MILNIPQNGKDDHIQLFFQLSLNAYSCLKGNMTKGWMSQGCYLSYFPPREENVHENKRHEGILSLTLARSSEGSECVPSSFCPIQTVD